MLTSSHNVFKGFEEEEKIGLQVFRVGKIRSRFIKRILILITGSDLVLFGQDPTKKCPKLTEIARDQDFIDNTTRNTTL